MTQTTPTVMVWLIESDDMSCPTDTNANILQTYDEQASLYHAFAECLQVLLGQILKASNLRPQSITGRVKSRKSLEEKISRPGKSYSELADLNDICGLRITTYYAAEVDEIASLLEHEFEIDRDHCVDKRIYEDPDRFGYQSLHYVVSLKKDRVNLPEYSAFGGLKAEIQVRTVIQHAWAEIEHDLGYKSLSAVPRDAKRKLFRLAALLEMADEEFTAVKDTLTERTKKVRADLQRGDFDVELDSASLTEFAASDSSINDCDRRIADSTQLVLENEWLSVSSLATWLKSVGIQTIRQLRALLAAEGRFIVELATARLTGHGGPIKRGICLLYLSYCVAARSGGAKRIREFLESNNFKPKVGTERAAEDMIKAFSNLSNPP